MVRNSWLSTDNVETINTFGALHVLVNCAGVMLEKNSLDTTEEEYDRVMNVNVKSMFFSCKYAIQ